MVLLAGPGPEGGGARCLSPQPPTQARGAQAGDDPADYEEFEDFSSLPDTRSIASDDSFYPPGDEECGAGSAEGVPEGVPEAATLLRAACTNDVGLLRALVRRGPRVEEVQETDRNGRGRHKLDTDSMAPNNNNMEEKRGGGDVKANGPLLRWNAFFGSDVVLEYSVIDRILLRLGMEFITGRAFQSTIKTGLIVACYHGFVDTVVALAECPHVDVNWQDSEGNTALITAVQAGHTTITNYLLNYFPGLDLERRNVFGFTALMKAAMQGRTECVRALMLAGADIHARDPRRGMSPQEWAAYTGRVEAVRLMQRLLERPCPEQFGEKYRPDLLLAPEAALKPAGSKNCLQRLAEFLRSALTSRSGQSLEDGGVLDHMVRVTTSLYSPAVAIVCQTVCPENPPCVGKRRLAVQEILAARGSQGTQARESEEAAGSQQQFRTCEAEEGSREEARRASLASPQLPGGRRGIPAPRKASLLPLQLLRRSSVRPGVVVPRVRISKAPAPTFQPERVASKGSTKDSAHLQIPKWRYKEAKEEKRKAEEAEKQRLAEAQKERRAPLWRKRT